MQYLTIDEAADALGVCVNTIRKLLPELGAVDVLKGSNGKKRLIRIPEWAIEAYLDGCRIIPPKAAVKKPKPKTVMKIERRKA